MVQGNIQTADDLISAAVTLGRRCRYDMAHTERVTAMALRVFDDLVELHRLGPAERTWLEAAAVLHDIGWIEGHKGHHKTALRLILTDETLPIDKRLRRIIASVARYHRRALPEVKHEHFAAFPETDRRTVRRLSAILRVADGLDRSHAQIVRSVEATVGDDAVTIRLGVAGDPAVEIEAATKKADLFEQVFGRRVVFETTGV